MAFRLFHDNYIQTYNNTLIVQVCMHPSLYIYFIYLFIHNSPGGETVGT